MKTIRPLTPDAAAMRRPLAAALALAALLFAPASPAFAADDFALARTIVEAVPDGGVEGEMIRGVLLVEVRNRTGGAIGNVNLRLDTSEPGAIDRGGDPGLTSRT